MKSFAFKEEGMFALILFLSLNAEAAVAKIDFIASTNVPGVTVEGKADDVKVDYKADKAVGTVVELDVFQLLTGMEKRDQHLREKVFAAKKEGDAKIRFEVLEMPAADGELKGKLSIKGVEQQIQVPVKRDGLTVSGSTKISLEKFALPRPSFMGVKVDDAVEVSFKITE
jgi:polyisoprenoid-binding protein YceI